MTTEGARYTGFWIRVVAYIIDAIIFTAVQMLIASVIIGSSGALDAIMADPETMTPEQMEAMMANLGPLVIVQFVPMVMLLTFWLWLSSTPGKLIFGAKIRDAETGEKPSVGQFIIRFVGYIISAIVICLGFFWIGFDKRKQGWHDKMAGTVVVYTRGEGGSE